tara:strand:+ start:203 stop:457 length:255 start_codon:yes stop_codon:yes gene_type:complete
MHYESEYLHGADVDGLFDIKIELQFRILGEPIGIAPPMLKSLYNVSSRVKKNFVQYNCLPYHRTSLWRYSCTTYIAAFGGRHEL